MSAPFNTMSGAVSPPMASRAIVRGVSKIHVLSRVGSDRALGMHHLAGVIVPTRPAHVMGALQFPTVGAFDVSGGFQGVVRTPHVPP